MYKVYSAARRSTCGQLYFFVAPSTRNPVKRVEWRTAAQFM